MAVEKICSNYGDFNQCTKCLSPCPSGQFNDYDATDANKFN